MKESKTLEIDLIFILKKLWFSKIIIILSTLVFTVVALGYSIFLIQPKYQSTTKVYVVNKNAKEVAVTTQDIQLGNFLIKDYKEIILSNQVMNEVIEENNLTMSPAALAKKVSIDSPKDTRVLSITVEDTNAELASDLANSIRKISSEQIKEITKIDKVTTIEEAKPSLSQSSPNIAKNSIFAGAIGFVLAVLLIVARELLDDKIKKPEDIEEGMEMILLGVIPDTKK